MTTKKWTETVIKQAFDNFIKRHDRLPSHKEMYQIHKGKFPPSSSVKLIFGISLSQYLKTNYTEYYIKREKGVYGEKPKEYWIEDFKKQYIKNKRPIERVYNELRSINTPSTQTLRKIIGVSTWSELLSICGLEEEKIKLRGVLLFEESEENYQKLNEKLQEFLQSLK